MRKLKAFITKILSVYNGKPLIAMALILAVMFISPYLIKDKTEDIQKQEENNVSVYDSKFESEKEEIMSVYGIQEIKVKEGETEAEIRYINPEQNTDKYYIRISITLDDGENVYSSDLIPPGTGITNIKFTRSFDKGNYHALFHVQGYRMSDLSISKGTDLDIRIVVE